jgi:hypothetical protein
VLRDYIDGKPVLWAQIAIGKTYLLLKEYEKAISIAKRTLSVIGSMQTLTTFLRKHTKPRHLATKH